MSDQIEPNKRKLVQSLAVGSSAMVVVKALPDQWARPVVSTAVVPAHAAASGCFDGNELSFERVEVEEGKVEIEVECSLFEIADGTPYEAVIERTGGSSEESNEWTLEGTITCDNTGIDVEPPEIEGELTSYHVLLEANGCQISAESSEFSDNEIESD